LLSCQLSATGNPEYIKEEFKVSKFYYRSGSYCRLHEPIEESKSSPVHTSASSQTTRSKSSQRFNEEKSSESKIFLEAKRIIIYHSTFCTTRYVNNIATPVGELS